jgi:ribulose-phosphate 3-epimerase
MSNIQVCPTITAADPHEYRKQLEQVQPFASRVHIDLMDGEFAPSHSPALENIWWFETMTADIHLMYKNPMDYIEALIKLKPSLVIVHFEANVDHEVFTKRLRDNQIKTGLALLQQTAVDQISQVGNNYDHILIFSGHLGYHGGEADLTLLEKVKEVHTNFPETEISWDGGINDKNAKSLVEAGVEVLNVGSFIQDSDEPKNRYETIVSSTG